MFEKPALANTRACTKQGRMAMHTVHLDAHAHHSQDADPARHTYGRHMTPDPLQQANNDRLYGWRAGRLSQAAIV